VFTVDAEFHVRFLLDGRDIEEKALTRSVSRRRDSVGVKVSDKLVCVAVYPKGKRSRLVGGHERFVFQKRATAVALQSLENHWHV